MTDLGNGDYTFDYSVDLDGMITIQIYTYDDGARADYYRNNYWGGGILQTSYVSNIEFDWGAGPVFSTYDDYASIVFTFSLIPPYSETYFLQITSDDNSTMYYGGSAFLDGYNAPASYSISNSMSMVANQLYSFVIYYQETGGGANIRLYWSSPSLGSLSVIAANYFSNGNGYYVSGTPFNLNTYCPHGYTGYDPSSPTM